MAKMAQEVDCPLLELPPEIRNTIWELILPEMFDVFTVNRPPALLGTCRQIRNEAHDLFFSTAVFEAQSHEIVCNFLGAFSPKAHASITNFRFFPYFVRDHSPQLQKLRLLRVPVAQAGLDYLTEDLKLVGVLLRPGALRSRSSFRRRTRSSGGGLVLLRQRGTTRSWPQVAMYPSWGRSGKCGHARRAGRSC